MANYTRLNESMIPQIEGEIGTGINNLFGDPLLISVFGLFLIVALGFTLQIDIDTHILAGLGMILTLFETVLPAWIFWLALLPLGIYAGVVFSRLIHK